jgi:hypothetical protein
MKVKVQVMGKSWSSQSTSIHITHKKMALSPEKLYEEYSVVNKAISSHEKKH